MQFKQSKVSEDLPLTKGQQVIWNLCFCLKLSTGYNFSNLKLQMLNIIDQFLIDYELTTEIILHIFSIIYMLSCHAGNFINLD